MTEPAFAGDSIPSATAQCARSHLARGRTLEQDGRILEATRSFEAAIRAAEFEGNQSILSEALRRLAVARHGGREFEAARKTAARSHRLASDLGDKTLTAEALNALASFDIDAGAHDSAMERLSEALELCNGDQALHGRVLQHLAVVANMRGDHRQAAEYCEQSLEAFLAAGDDEGCARAYHNMGMMSAGQERWDDAELHYRRSRAIAKKLGDSHLQALCLLDQTEVLIARQHYEDARECADAALAVFNELGDSAGKAGVYRFLGMIDRELGAPALAEGHLRLSIELATGGKLPLQEAEAKRELALLYQDLGKNLEAFEQLNAAHRLFGRLAARVDRVDVARKRSQIERTFLQMVRSWGQSIETADRYTHGHSERVASFAYGVGRVLGLNRTDLMTVRVGAYLHDVGKTRVPHEILNKPGPLTPTEFAVIKRHPEWGVDLLETAEFPWDVLPIVRWHHEKLDGSGYPDGLQGDEIPLAAQIICVADVYDALTTDRSYRPARTKPMTLSIMRDHHYWWRPDVFDAFMRTMGR
jgi:putative nucleotidyltransferase with HDIG domain